MVVTTALPGSDTPCGRTLIYAVWPCKKLANQQMCLLAVAVVCWPVCDGQPLHPTHSRGTGASCGLLSTHRHLAPGHNSPGDKRHRQAEPAPRALRKAGPPRPQPWALQKLGAPQCTVVSAASPQWRGADKLPDMQLCTVSPSESTSIHRADFFLSTISRET